MALEGFAQGALAGFGAVNKFYDDQRRRDLDQRQIDNLKAYRDETLEAARLDRGLKREQLEADKKRNARLDSISSVNAQAGLLRAQTAQSEQKRIMGSLNESGETPGEEQSRLLNEARTKQVIAEADKTTREEFRLAGGVDISRLFEIAQMEGVPTQELQNEFAELVAKNSKNPTTFNVSRLISQAEQDAQRNVTSVFENLSRGSFEPLNRSQLDALGRTFGFDTAAYLGQKVDDFPKAPSWLKTDGRKVVGSGLYGVDIGGGAGGKPAVVGDMVVWTETPDGDLHPYFPSLTNFRDPNGLPAQIDIGNEAVPAAAGHAYMVNSLSANPRFVDMVDRALIQDRFGGAGDSGQETFDKRVNEKMELVEKAYTNGQDQMLDMPFLLQDGETLQSMYDKNISVLEARIKDDLLGKSASTTWGREADEWLKANAMALAEVPLPGGVVGTNLGQFKRQGTTSAQTIGDLDVFSGYRQGVFNNPSEVSRIAFLFDSKTGRLKKGIGRGEGTDSNGMPDGSDLTEEQMLIKVLREFGADI